MLFLGILFVNLNPYFGNDCFCSNSLMLSKRIVRLANSPRAWFFLCPERENPSAC